MIKLEIALFLAALLGVVVGAGVFTIWNRLRKHGLDSWKSKRTMTLFLGLVLIFGIVTLLENYREPLVKQVRYELGQPQKDITTGENPVAVQRVRISRDNASMGFISRPVYKRQLIFAGATLILLFTLNADIVRSRFGKMKLGTANGHGQNIPANVDRAQLLSDLKAALAHDKMYTNPELNLDTLAQALHVSKYHLSLIINEELSKNFYELVNGYRVDEAISLLNDPKNEAQSLLGIGYEVGFNSKASFYRAFKKQTGTTPAAYRNSVKQC